MVVRSDPHTRLLAPLRCTQSRAKVAAVELASATASAEREAASLRAQLADATRALTEETSRLRSEHAEILARTQAAADDAVRKLSARVAAAQAAGEEGRAALAAQVCVCVCVCAGEVCKITTPCRSLFKRV